MEISKAVEIFRKFLNKSDKSDAVIEKKFFRAIPRNSESGPLECGHSFYGNRYNPPQVMTALYFSDDELRAPKEAGFGKRSCRVYEVFISASPVISLGPGILRSLGLNRQELTNIDWTVPQQVGLSAFMAEASGIIVPSALSEDLKEERNLVLFPTRLLASAGIKVVTFRDH